jgi:hypothetical protein
MAARAATPKASASAVPTSTTASAATAPGTILFRTRLIYRQVTAAHIHSVQRFHCPGSRLIVGHLDEGKSSWLAGVTVGNNTYPVNLPVSLEQCAHLFFVGIELQISHIDVFHISLAN